jgi:hypothetical protein
MLMTDSSSPARKPVTSLFLEGILVKFHDFLDSSSHDPENPPKAEAFPAGKSLISGIPGFPAGGSFTH